MAIRRILFVEKRQEVLHAVPVLLKNRGFEVITAANAPAALPHAKKSDLLIAAINEPAWTETKTLLAHFRKEAWKPAIAITGYAMPHNIEELRAAGFDEVITEPLNVHRLISAIQNFE
jgi:CheY-like chemotaxis protein